MNKQQVINTVYPTFNRVENLLSTFFKAALSSERAEAALVVLGEEIWRHADDRIAGVLTVATESGDSKIIGKTLSNVMQSVEGRVLTVVDALIDPVRAQACKDIAHRIVWEPFDKLRKMLK